MAVNLKAKRLGVQRSPPRWSSRGCYLVFNTLANLEARRIASGFAFLWREAGFEVGESPSRLQRRRHLCPGAAVASPILPGGDPRHPPPR